MIDAETMKIPVHVGLIMDGNGRWAKEKDRPRTAGHQEGIESVRAVVKYAKKVGIRYLTLYAFSTENWKRSEQEVGFLMNLLIQVAKKEVPELHRQGVRIRFIGSRENLPDNILKAITDSEILTADNTDLTVNIAFNYGGRDEIKRAVKKIASDVSSGTVSVSDITESLISDYLDTSGTPDPDLIIRTSGEYRISNFLLYQAAYSEFYFPKVYWPDFREEEFEKALVYYSQRDRRYGKA